LAAGKSVAVRPAEGLSISATISLGSPEV